MDEPKEPLTPDELDEQEPSLLPDREAMSVVNPLPEPIGEDDILYPVDPTPKYPFDPTPKV
jgi:hypothetical protein